MNSDHRKYGIHVLTTFFVLALLFVCGLSGRVLAQVQTPAQIQTIEDMSQIYDGTLESITHQVYENRYDEPMEYPRRDFRIINREIPIPRACESNFRMRPPQCMYKEMRERMMEMRLALDAFIEEQRRLLDDVPDVVQPLSLTTTDGPTSSASMTHTDDVNKNIDNIWVGGLKRMTRQMSATMMQQAMAVGTFIDARQQLRTQQVLQELTADAHADYRPDTAMCVFGTNVRSLAATNAIAHANAAVMNEVLMQREVLRLQAVNPTLTSSAGPSADYKLRYSQFKTTYCNPEDYGGELREICDVAAPSTTRPSRANMDINYTHNFDLPYTLDIDFSDGVITPDEEDILALSRNLFGSRIFTPIPQDFINQAQTVNDFTDVRAVHAVRSVSRNSFTKLVGMKAKGNASTQSYLRAIVSALGGQESSGGSVSTLLTDAELNELVGSNPSYFAQMEILTSKLYQNPSFYVNLYSSPENVARAGVALKAFELIQDRDRYESALRREMFVAMLVEMNLRDEQVNLNNEIFGSITDLVRSPLAQ